MLQEIVITPGTVVVLLIIAAWAVWALRRMFKRGLCDCGDHCGEDGSSGCAHCGGSCAGGGCASCELADKMTADAERSLR